MSSSGKRQQPAPWPGALRLQLAEATASPAWRGVVGVVLVLGLWLALSWNSKSTYFPPLHVMLADAADYWLTPDGWGDIRSTCGNLVAGLLLGIAGGALAGLAVGQVRILNLAVSPLIEFLRAIPGVALLPVAIALLGIGNSMKIVSIALSVAWPVLINVVDGLRQFPSLWLDTARVFKFSTRLTQLEVVLPALVPRLVAGIQVAVPLSLVVAVTSEMIGTTSGIGSVVLNAQSTFDVARMWSGVLLLGVIGAVLTAGTSLLDRWLGSLYPSDLRASSTAKNSREH